MWSELKSSSNVSMWCDGLVSTKKSGRKKRKVSEDETDSDEPQPKHCCKKRTSDETLENVQEIIEKLQNLH